MLDTSSLQVPSTSGNSAATTSNTHRTVDKNYADFLKLLTTQLQNQDPTAPLDTNDLTQQIATLSQVEQQINTNDKLDNLAKVFAASQFNGTVGYIGKQVEAVGNQGALEKGHALFMYYMGSEAETVNVTIKDATGNVVYTGSGPKHSGRNEFVWDGKNNDGKDMAEGIYQIDVKAQDASHNDIVAQTYTTGIVTSIDSANGNVYASIGNILSLLLSTIVSVRQPPAPTA